MSQQHVQASHRDIELDAELRQPQAARFEQIERARNPQPDVSAAPAKKAPANKAPAVKSAPSRPFPPSSVGGQQSAGSVSGYLCQVCADAQAHVGSIGPAALKRG